jgi:hypothetical protein
VQLGRTILVATLVLAAGCNTVLGPDTPAIEEPVTPVPLTEPSPSPTTERPAPNTSLSWVRPDGRIDVARLLAGHRAALSNRSFTLVLTHRVTNESGTAAFGLLTLEADTAAAYYLLRPDETIRPLVGGADTATVRRYYVEDGDVYRKRTGPNGSTKTRASDVDVPAPTAYSANLLERYVPRSADRITLVERDGRRLYRVYVAPRTSRYRGPWQFDGVSDYTQTLYVTPEGLIVSMNVSYDEDRSDGRLEHTIRITHRRVNETAVLAPEWVLPLRENRTAPVPGTTPDE